MVLPSAKLFILSANLSAVVNAPLLPLFKALVTVVACGFAGVGVVCAAAVGLVEATRAAEARRRGVGVLALFAAAQCHQRRAGRVGQGAGARRKRGLAEVVSFL